MARVTITDGTYEELQHQVRGRGTLDAEVERRLVETLHAPTGRVVLSHEELDSIAGRLHTGLPIRTKADLYRVLDQTGQLTLGNVVLQFTPEQLRQIEEKATRVGETAERFVGRVAAKLLTDVFLVQPAEEGIFYTPGLEPEDDPVLGGVPGPEPLDGEDP